MKGVKKYSLPTSGMQRFGWISHTKKGGWGIRIGNKMDKRGYIDEWLEKAKKLLKSNL